MSIMISFDLIYVRTFVCCYIVIIYKLNNMSIYHPVLHKLH